MTELHPLIDATRRVQRRILANNFLFRWNKGLAWTLASLLIAAAVLPMKVVIIAAAMLLVAATVASIVVAWVSRPSTYESAWRLDQAAGLHDRLSTALHCAELDSTDPMILCQRRDALGRVAQLNPKALFALRVPAAAGRTFALALAVAGLFAYRVNHKPPLLVVAQKVAQSDAVRAILPNRPPDVAPDVREKEALADAREAVDADLDQQASLEPGAFSAEKQPDATDSGGDSSLPSDQSAQADAGDAEQNAYEEEDKANSTSGPVQKDSGGRDSQGDAQKGEKSPDETGDGPPPDSPSSSPSQSLAQKIGQALKDLLAKATGQAPRQEKPPQSPPGNQNADGQNGPQPKNPSGDQPPGKSSEPKSNAEPQSGGMGAPQDAGLPGEGNDPTGSKPGALQTTQNPSLETHTTPEVVPLVSTKFKGQANVLTTSQSGKAQLPLLETSPRPTATTNGAEQGDVPLRYRFYVQHYFDHPDKVGR